MRLSTRVVRASRFAILTLVAVVFSGCLSGEETILGRYDAAKDEFCFLNIYQRIGSDKPADLQYLYGLWQNRDHLITPPFPAIFGKTSFLRLSPTELVTINLGESPKSIDASPSPVALDSIMVKPGKLFARGEALCYYDQIVVPGKVIDQIVEEASKEQRKSMPAAIAAEIERRKSFGRVWRWDEYRKLALKNLSGDETTPTTTEPKPGDAKPPETAPDDILQYLSTGTLEALAKGLADGSIKIVRKGPVFTLALPVAEEDMKAVLAIVKEVREQADAMITKGTGGKNVVATKKLTDPIQLKAASPTVLEVSIDVTDLFKAMDALQHPAAPLEAVNEETTKGAAAALAAMKEKGVPIDDKLSVDQILSQFKDGTLAANPSEKPVKPGDGLVIATKEEAK